MATWSMLSFQDTASPVMTQLMMFYDFVMIVVIMIMTVVGLIMMFMVSYKFTNKYMLQEQWVETIWTILPMLVMFVIVLPAFRTLYLLDDPFMSSLTLKTTGHQWYWSYEYSDFPNVEFDSYMVPKELSLNRLLDVDNNTILPVYTQVRVILSSTDVIHAWTVPALGIKSDAVPGRLNQVLFFIDRLGNYYGQCSEICGANHSFMPIKIESTFMKNFLSWLSHMF
uniref:Cytochrome c oxidase subunit 2 n=1 Tax=Halice sp. JL-2018 TaxID=2528348 RepID=A0A3Q8LXG6_9CRUS|nr:cytochrome c oxidase subunit 2 [Halice sp. JL-2018]